MSIKRLWVWILVYWTVFFFFFYLYATISLQGSFVEEFINFYRKTVNGTHELYGPNSKARAQTIFLVVIGFFGFSVTSLVFLASLLSLTVVQTRVLRREELPKHNLYPTPILDDEQSDHEQKI